MSNFTGLSRDLSTTRWQRQQAMQQIHRRKTYGFSPKALGSAIEGYLSQQGATNHHQP